MPRQHSTGGKARLGRITKASNQDIRTLLVLGATRGSSPRAGSWWCAGLGKWNSAAGAWIRGVPRVHPRIIPGLDPGTGG